MIRPPRSAWTQAEIDTLWSMFGVGRSVEQIARRLHRTKRAVQDKIRLRQTIATPRPIAAGMGVAHGKYRIGLDLPPALLWRVRAIAISQERGLGPLRVNLVRAGLTALPAGQLSGQANP